MVKSFMTVADRPKSKMVKKKKKSTHFQKLL